MIASPLGKAGLVVCATHTVENTAIAKAHADNNVLTGTSYQLTLRTPAKLVAA